MSLKERIAKAKEKMNSNADRIGESVASKVKPYVLAGAMALGGISGAAAQESGSGNDLNKENKIELTQQKGPDFGKAADFSSFMEVYGDENIKIMSNGMINPNSGPVAYSITDQEAYDSTVSKLMNETGWSKKVTEGKMVYYALEKGYQERYEKGLAEGKPYYDCAMFLNGRMKDRKENGLAVDENGELKKVAPSAMELQAEDMELKAADKGLDKEQKDIKTQLKSANKQMKAADKVLMHNRGRDR